MQLQAITNVYKPFPPSTWLPPNQLIYPTRHSSTSWSISLTGYPTVPKHLSSLVPTPTHSPNYMFPASSLDCIIIQEGTDNSETSVNK